MVSDPLTHLVETADSAGPTEQAALLPAGLADLLAPEARAEALTIDKLISRCEAFGYERVKPPLLEFEEGLLTGPGKALAGGTFRLMDPVSQRMLALRADMTPQVVRIAACRLTAVPRPLRLCYAGQVLRQRGGQLRPERQFGQIGAELIGDDSVASDSEVALLAADALMSLGIQDLSLDLCLPSLVGHMTSALGLPERQAELLAQALDRKDAATVAALGGDQAQPFLDLLASVGPLETSLPRLAALSLPPVAAEQVERLIAVAESLTAAAPNLTLTVDPVEHRGHRYQIGLSFTLFGKGVRGELGRGGRYLADCLTGGVEPATGFTLFSDSLMRAVTPPPPRLRVYLPAGSDRGAVEALRQEGWATVSALQTDAAPEAEARRLRCSHIFRDGAAQPLSAQEHAQ
ncbi:MAG: ATP phosphoribosyltransferase regulatory subunit [Pseudomonadota bacterium]